MGVGDDRRPQDAIFYGPTELPDMTGLTELNGKHFL